MGIPLSTLVRITIVSSVVTMIVFDVYDDKPTEELNPHTKELAYSQHYSTDSVCHIIGDRPNYTPTTTDPQLRNEDHLSMYDRLYENLLRIIREDYLAGKDCTENIKKLCRHGISNSLVQNLFDTILVIHESEACDEDFWTYARENLHSIDFIFIDMPENVRMNLLHD